MTRRGWTDIALALADVRGKLLEHAARSTKAKALHLERVKGVELAARAICRTLRARSQRFDARRFMHIVAAQNK